MNLIFSKASILCLTASLASFSVQANIIDPVSGKDLTYKSPEGNFKLKVGGRLHLDGASFQEDKTALKDDWIVRRARLSLSADIYKDWRISGQYAFEKTNKQLLSLSGRYKGFNKTYITAGQFQEPFSLEEATSSHNLSFMERSLANALIPEINVGLAVQRWGSGWGVKAGAFRETHLSDSDPFTTAQGSGYSGRFTFAPIRDKNTLLHLGTSLSSRLPADTNKLRIRTQPESDVTPETFVSTGRMRNVSSQSILGVEAMFVQGPVALQSEYITTNVARFGGKQDETFKGGYLSASWLINGKKRAYSSKSGTLKSVKVPRNSGLWEVAVRRSFLDLNSTTGTITGGSQSNTTYAVNWYLNKKTRLMFNYIDVDTDAEAGNDDPSIMQLRMQLAL